MHGDDLAVATYGRGFWVLDQMSPLREMAVNEKQIRSERAHLFAPGETYAAVIRRPETGRRCRMKIRRS